ncbi:hypothetical protein BB8028_0008g01920 [Beauveria bassiana]|uniref:Uncharacterized protein n=1 Tax=Beauveria bassiana TaxID=176275 RepID=A0A2S7YNR2_BEABA|nr:hypothetical protein BB8028_0008g01920 [Beauveria bassiana]
MSRFTWCLMLILTRGISKTPDTQHELEAHREPRNSSPSSVRDVAIVAREDIMSEASRSNIPTATGEYTSEDVDILTAALHTPPPATAPSPNIAFHDKIFITIVGPPPALQPSFTQAPSTTPSSSSTTPRAHPSSTSQSRTAQQPDATGTGRSSNQSTSSSATETAVQPVTSSIQPSQSPDKQPDSAPTPVSASGGLSRGAEAGIVVGILGMFGRHVPPPLFGPSSCCRLTTLENAQLWWLFCLVPSRFTTTSAGRCPRTTSSPAGTRIWCRREPFRGRIRWTCRR